ncbi:hypothetical protein B0H16DRAFT_1549877 [Mycena metata]|uniref:G-protein coupled receptors family 2 profile 2 domain-containing protein n=1 Tax=Mycena metata TaxID=1033252 RepID=A0AAD7IWJ3_9AGAR|nr:hypothetical protein B0H16DRAFT_1549877 [Mycena metata]
MAFTYTKEDALTSYIWGISAAIGACFCFLVLVLIAALYTRPSTRKFLNRVSFRIMVYALACNMVHGIATAVCAFQTANSRGCGFSVWVILLTLQCSSWLIFGIALNLQLVHGQNGHTMEKFYILSALVIAISVTVPPLATKQYGWDPLNEACWMTATEPKTRLRWQLGCQVIWSLFAAVGETIVFITVSVYMFRHQFVHGRRIQNASRVLIGSAPVDAKTRTMKHATTYRKVIIRISFYPMASMILNGITVGCDLFVTSARCRILILHLDNLMYGLRPSIYALLAVSDPALIRAVRSLLHRDSSSIDSGDRPLSFAPSTLSHKRPMTLHIELEELHKKYGGKTPPPPPPSPRSEFKMDLDSPIQAEFDKVADAEEAWEGRRTQLERVIEERTAQAVERVERKNFKTQI